MPPKPPAVLLAVAMLAAACARDPEALADHLRLGDKALAEGRYADAIAAYTHAHDLAANDPRVQRGMMEARVHIMAETPARFGNDILDDVRYEATFLLERDKAHEALYLTAIGNVLGRKGEFDAARAKLAEAVKSDPRSAVAHTALGTLLLARKERHAEARGELELALAAKPDDQGALLGLGQLALAEGDAAGAVGKLEAALRCGDDFGVRMALGNARLQQQKPAEAAEQLRRAAEIDPRSADAQASLGQALLAAGQLDEAERALRSALTLRQDQATALALGFTLAREKKSEAAFAVFTQILAQSPGLPAALYGVAATSEDLGRVEQALEYYRRVLQIPVAAGQEPMLADLRKEAQARTTALSAARAAASAAAAPDAGPPRR